MSKKNYRQKHRANTNGSKPIGADIPQEVETEENMDNTVENALNPSSPQEEDTNAPEELTQDNVTTDEEPVSQVLEEAEQETQNPQDVAGEEPLEELPQEETNNPAQEETEETQTLPLEEETSLEEKPFEETSQEEESQKEESQEEESQKEESQQEESQEKEGEGEEAEKEEEEEGPKIHITKWIYIGACAAVLAICFLAFFIHARREPISVTKKFLSSIQQLDFDTMESLLVDDDLTALASADLGNPVYAQFFKDVNSKMTYSIAKTQFRLGSSTAKVNARIHHIDGTQLYEKVLNQFLLDIVSSAFSGESVSQEETQEKLVSLLTDFYQQLPEQYSDTEICYQLEKTEEGWKISALDEMTVKVMSANFKSIENEIQAILSGERPASGQAGTGSLSNNLIDLTSSEVIHISNDEYEVMFNSYRFEEDYAGDTCLLYYYYFTNKSSNPASPMINLDLKVFQNGNLLSEAIPNQNEPALNNYYADLKQGQTTLVCQAFSLKDDSNLSVQVTDPYGATSSQIIRLQ